MSSAKGHCMLLTVLYYQTNKRNIKLLIKNSYDMLMQQSRETSLNAVLAVELILLMYKGPFKGLFDRTTIRSLDYLTI